MFCSKCGNEIKEGERFCSNCGKSVNDIEKDKNSNNFNKKIILVVLGIIVIVAIIGTIIFISNRKNSNVKNENANQMTNNIQQGYIIKENTKYVSTEYNVNEDIEMGFSYLYLTFNNTTFKLHFDANFGGDVYDMFIKGTYSQNENHIVFDFSNAKIGFNENEEEVTAEYKSIVNTWANILNNGVNISDEGKTLIAIDNTGKTITFKSNEQNNIKANKNQINQNAKYVATGIEDFYKQAGITELYLVFNNDEFKFVCNMNIGGDEYETYIKGTYNQTENHIIFDFSNAKAGYNNGKLDETGNIIDSWAELFKDGATISNENKTLTIAEVDGITLAFEDTGIQVAKEENTTSSNNIKGPKLSFTLAANLYNSYLEKCRFSHDYSRKDGKLKCSRLTLYDDIRYVGYPDIYNTIYCKDNEYTDMYKVEFEFYFKPENIDKITDESWNELQELYVYDIILRAVLGNRTDFDGIYPLADRSIEKGRLEKIKTLVNAGGDDLYNKLINNQINGLKYTYKEIGTSRYIIIEETE